MSVPAASDARKVRLTLPSRFAWTSVTATGRTKSRLLASVQSSPTTLPVADGETGACAF